MPSGRRGRVARGTTLLEAARQLGVEIESICGGRQTCGKCQVVVEEGHFAKHGLTSSAEHLSAVAEREAEYIAEHGLAQPPAGLRRRGGGRPAGQRAGGKPGAQADHRQGRHRARHRGRPAVRQVYVEVQGATMTSHGGRLGAAAASAGASSGAGGLRIRPDAAADAPAGAGRAQGQLATSAWA